MNQPNRPKWLAARRLHETYGVDQHVIADVADTTVGAIRHRASLEKWGQPGLAFALHERLLKLVEAQFDRIAKSDESVEKTARATAVVAKIVEDALGHQESKRKSGADDRDAGATADTDNETRAAVLAGLEKVARAEFYEGRT